MRDFTICLYCTTVILLSCCAGAKEVATPEGWKGRLLQFGSGGGFTGASDTYTLLDNGQLFLQSGIGNTAAKQLPKPDKKKTKELFAEAAKINWGDKDITEPGNMFYKLGYSNAGVHRQITWGSNTYKPAPEIAQLYANINSTISSTKKQ